MKRSISLPRCFAILLLTSSLLQADLVWDETVREKRADFGEEEIRFSFAFRNDGTEPVTIDAIEVSCGCTATSLEKDTYAPGERGTLEVLYRPDGQTGAQTKTVTVRTVEQPGRPATLTLKVNVPRLFDIYPRLVSWQLGGEPVEKAVSIKLHRNPQTSVSLVNPDDESLDIALRPGKGTGEHTLLLRPKSTAKVFRSVVRLRIESEGLPPQILAVYADLR